MSKIYKKDEIISSLEIELVASDVGDDKDHYNIEIWFRHNRATGETKTEFTVYKNWYSSVLSRRLKLYEGTTYDNCYAFIVDAVNVIDGNVVSIF